MATAVNGAGSAQHKKPAWWKESVVYQIYPSSFCDSNGDGIGDLPGITSKVPYLKYLGVDVVWLSPIYKSPQHDMGYDVSDYYDIHPPYGTIDDWRTLKSELKKAGIKIVMDLVANHTSVDHEWFQESRKSKDNPKRSWYYWQPPRFDEQGNRHPPNNWRSFFGAESAWEYDEATEEYYLRLFTKPQPDLNWTNPEVRQAVQDVMTFWLEEGIDGFRVDAINYIAKAEGFPDAEVTEPDVAHQPAMSLYLNRPKCHDYLRELGQKVLSKYDVFTVGETPHVEDAETALKFVHPDRQEFSMVFPWEPMDVDRVPATLLGHRKFPLSELKAVFDKWQTWMQERGGWNSIYLENHDQGRSISRFASDAPEHRVRSGKLLSTMMGTFSGTLYLHQGQEIGMVNLPKDWGIEEYSDVVSCMHYAQEKEKKQRATGAADPDMSDVVADINIKARDNGRTPMPWNGSLPGAGFTAGTPWRKVNPDAEVCNVEAAEKDVDGVLSFWKNVIALRKEWKTLVYGDFKQIEPRNERVFAYTRTLEGGDDALVVLNFCDGETRLSDDIMPAGFKGELVIGNYKETGNHNTLRPWESRVYRLGAGN